MSDHDRIQRPSEDGECDNPRWVSQHRGAYYEFIERHEYHARKALQDGIGGVRDLAPPLFERVSDERSCGGEPRMLSTR